MGIALLLVAAVAGAAAYCRRLAARQADASRSIAAATAAKREAAQAALKTLRDAEQGWNDINTKPARAGGNSASSRYR